MTQKKRRAVTGGERTVTREAVAAYKRRAALEAERDHLRDVLRRAFKLRRGDRHPLDVSVHDHSAVVFLPWGHPPTTAPELEASARVQETRIALERAAGLLDADARPWVADLPEARERWRRDLQRRLTPDVVTAFKSALEIGDEIFDLRTVLSLQSGRRPWETDVEDSFYQALAEAAARG